MSIVDGPGFRYTVFFQGCKHGCIGCHNRSTWCVDGGIEYRTLAIVRDIERCRDIDGVTVSGGEPFLQVEGLKGFVKRLKEMGYHIIVYTGYTYEEIVAETGFKGCLNYIDVLVDGKYIESERVLGLRFRGSKNQRAIDVQKSLNALEPVELVWDEDIL